MKRVVAALALVIATGHAGVAFAAEPAAPTVEDIKAAEASFTKGREAYKNGSFSEAAEHFESADSHAPNERVLELAISSRESAGHLDRAATLAQLALERHPESERLKKLAEPLLAKAQAELFQVTIECNEPCSLLDGTRLVHGAPSTKRVVFLTPGGHTIRAGWSQDRSESKPVQGEAGETRELAFDAPPIPEEPPPDPVTTSGGDVTADTRAPRDSYGAPPLYFWIAAGVTAAVGGVTIWSGVDTLNNPGKEAVRQACRGQGEDCPEYQDGKDKELRTNILLGATGVLGVGTIVLGALFTDWSGGGSDEARRAPNTAGITPWLDVSNGATLGATGRF